MDSQSSLRSDDKHAPICLAKVTRAPEGNRGGSAARAAVRRRRGSILFCSTYFCQPEEKVMKRPVWRRYQQKSGKFSSRELKVRILCEIDQISRLVFLPNRMDIPVDLLVIR